MTEKTREEHLKWCVERAIQEMDYYRDPSKAYVSMASDLKKHPETNKESLISLCMLQLVSTPRLSRQQVIDFLKGFN